MPTTSLRRRISLFSRSSELFDQSWRQCSLGSEGEDLGAGLVEERRRLGEALLELGDDPAVLRVHRPWIGLGEDRARRATGRSLGRG
jgi:hypothetical protein